MNGNNTNWMYFIIFGWFNRSFRCFW